MTVPKTTENFNPAPRWIMGVRDLATETAAAAYQITMADGKQIQTTLKSRKRQMVDSLIEGPVYCASPVRLGDAVFRLKQDHNIHADTNTAPDGRKFYALNATVEPIGGAK